MKHTTHNFGENGVKELFLKLIHKTTPNGFEHLMYDHIPGAQADGYGNRYVIIGSKPQHLFTCHLDTYPLDDDHGLITCTEINIIDEGSIIRTDGTTILGADDKAGMTVMLSMISAGITGIYGFFLAEENGLNGSHFAAMDPLWNELMQDVKAVISFDRKGINSIITHQRHERTCSDEFALELQKEFEKYDLKMMPDENGSATDSYSFFESYPHLQCTNISVGYWDQHTKCEYQDIYHLERLCNAAISMQWPIPRLG
jgi:hypothetical protein